MLLLVVSQRRLLYSTVSPYRSINQPISWPKQKPTDGNVVSRAPPSLYWHQMHQMISAVPWQIFAWFLAFGKEIIRPTLCTGRWWVGREGRGLGGAEAGQTPPRCTKCNSPPINGQCTYQLHIILCDTVPLPIEGFKYIARIIHSLRGQQRIFRLPL